VLAGVESFVLHGSVFGHELAAKSAGVDIGAWDSLRHPSNDMEHTAGAAMATTKASPPAMRLEVS
jgi:hypothetical protein